MGQRLIWLFLCPTRTEEKTDGIVGWQRIDHHGGKFQTSAITNGDFVGTCFVIGDLKGAQNVAVTEGFATGASVWLATGRTRKNALTLWLWQYQPTT
ncbi:hypothetical protein [Enterobacter hormaechei]|uniref:hypothetical protein n=1 Tax=Enterobacter hormaechei TaxID=158836 RepID=UPI00388E5B6D